LRSSRRSLLGPLVLAAAALSPAAGPEALASVRTFEITASRFAYDPDVLEVNEGDEVRLVARSADTVHGLEIKELKVKIKIPKGGAPVRAGFVATRPGTFTITCSEYCGTGHRRMKARLVVAPRSAE
jgi:cytochrome c oxidase subunit 2